METILIKDATIVNENKSFKGSVLIKDNKIEDIYIYNVSSDILNNSIVIDGKGKYLFPGVIDEHVHFREPGYTDKGDIYTESKAAIAGGVTSFMDMPNNNPSTTTLKYLEDKFDITSKKSLANYSFYIGATNDNIDEILRIDPKEYCGIKIFLGQSTGNLYINNKNAIINLLKNSKNLIAAHCEDNDIIKQRLKIFKSQYGDLVPIPLHHLIRTEEACYKSSLYIINLAKKYNSRLHVAHISTEKELGLLDNSIPLKEKLITSEVCIHHLYFDNILYNVYGNLIKTNPSIKTKRDKNALLEALINDTIDTIATDHAPHTLAEKQQSYLKAPSGCPMIQHSLTAMLEFYHDKKISLEKIVEKMCHAPADIFAVKNRGYIRKGYFADLVLVDMNTNWQVNKDNILYKCGWSNMEGQNFHSKVTHTFVNGNLVYDNGTFNESVKGSRLEFER